MDEPEDQIINLETQGGGKKTPKLKKQEEKRIKKKKRPLGSAPAMETNHSLKFPTAPE